MLLIHRRLLPSILFLAGFSSAAFAQLTTTSAGSYGPIVAPDSIASAWGMNLSASTASATNFPLPFTLGNVQVFVTDSAGAKTAASLFLVSPGQINFLVPASAAVGKGSLAVVSGGATFQGDLLISNIAPAIFTANSDGKGVPAAQVLRITAAGTVTLDNTFKGAGPFTVNPINVQAASDRLYLMLYGTGLRRHSLNPVKAAVGGVSVPVLYAGPQSQFQGLDQINLGPLPAGLQGKGDVDVIITVDGVPANTVRLNFQ